MTQSLLAFDELAPGAQIGIATTDRGVISGTAIPGGSSASSSPLAPQPASLQGGLIVDPNNVTGVATANGSATATVDASGNPNVVVTVTGRVFNSWANLVAAWGTVSPCLNVNTTIVFTSSNGPNDPIYFSPISNTPMSVVVRAPLQLLATSALASVVAKNRTAGANSTLQADLGVAALVNTMVVNTTRGNSVAHLDLSLGGTTWSISQPMTPVAPPNTTLPSEVDTWANTDAIQLFGYVNLFFTSIQPALTNPTFSGTSASSNTTTVFHCRLNIGAAATGILAGAVDFIETDSNCALLPIGPANTLTAFINHHFETGGILSQACQNVKIIAGCSNTTTAMGFTGRSHTIDGDFICRGDMTFDGGLVNIGFVFIGDGEQITGSGGARVNFATVSFGGHCVYGTATAQMNARGQSRFFNGSGTYAAAFTYPLAISTGIQINGQVAAWSATTAAPSVINGGIATTVANLDAAAGAAGFGGVAFRFGGASISNVGQ